MRRHDLRERSGRRDIDDDAAAAVYEFALLLIMPHIVLSNNCGGEESHGVTIVSSAHLHIKICIWLPTAAVLLRCDAAAPRRQAIRSQGSPVHNG
ncbi:unnamed protein product [Merluccius merluccius]